MERRTMLVRTGIVAVLSLAALVVAPSALGIMVAVVWVSGSYLVAALVLLAYVGLIVGVAIAWTRVTRKLR